MQNWSAIFDWDGVIVDSSSQHEAAWERLAVEESRPLPKGFFRKSFGMKNDRVITTLLGWTERQKEIQQLSLRKEEMFREIIRSQKQLEPLPGVLTFLERLEQAGVKCAVASSTPRQNIDCILPTLGIARFFREMVCAEDVKRGKPDPEVFLLAATKLGARANRCVVFEDAHVGIEAAQKAGMRVVGVATTHPAESLKGTDCVVGQLDQLDLGMVNKWFA